MKVPLLLFLATPLLGACTSTESAAEETPHFELADERPVSAFVALVRTLETIDAIRPVDAEVRLRAVECRTMLDREHGGERVRVLLDLTVLADDFDTVDGTFAALERALEAEGNATRRQQTVDWARAARVFDSMQWNAPRVAETEVFDALVSSSRSLTVEVRNPRTAELVVGSGPDAGDSQDAGLYIRSIAADDDVAIGAVVTKSSVVHPRDGIADIRYSIRPVDKETALSREQIGGFLHQLESQSPNVRVTRVKISPSAPGADVTDDTWTFEADISLRVRET